MKKILIVLSLLLLISCHSKDHKMENAVYDEDGYPLAKRDVSLYKPNPDAKQDYKVKVEIRDAPEPLKLQDFIVSYQADNCCFTTSRWAGATAVYQDLATGELIVAHRGTEGDLRDIATDGAMGFYHKKPQVKECRVSLNKNG